VQNYVTGSFARSLENPQTMANFAINIERYGLPKSYYADYLKNVAAVTVEDIQQVAQQYLQPEKAHIIVVGKAEEIAEGLAQFGEVKKFDIYGEEEVVLSEDAAAEANSQIDQILEKYLEAIGGREALAAVEDIAMRGTIEAQGQTLNMTQIKAGDRYLTLLAQGFQEVQKVIYNQGKAKVYMMDQSKDMEGKELEALKTEAIVFPELQYKELGYTFEYKGTKKIKKKEAHKIEITTPQGISFTDYYDAETGLKVRSDTPQGTVTILEYQEVKGIMLPKSTTISGPMGVAEFTVNEVDVNAGVVESLFELK
jgi:hypothetical protein